MRKIKYKIPHNRLTKIAKLAGDVSNKKILDIGCAEGDLGKFFKTKKNQVVGIDISKDAIKIAQKRLDRAIVLDVTQNKLPFPAKEFDLVICSEVIEHLLSADKLLSEIKRVLKKDGFLIISTPNILYWGHRLQFLKGKFEYEEQGPFDKTHIHFYTYKSLKKELE